MVVVLACGCFDPLHAGHVAHLKAARAIGDHLVVALTVDEKLGKGSGRPLMPYEHRLLALRELRCVDQVIPNWSARESILTVLPDIYVKGIEYKGHLPEQDLVERHGGRVVFLDTEPVYSSTRIITGEMLRDRLAAIGTGGR